LESRKRKGGMQLDVLIMRETFYVGLTCDADILRTTSKVHPCTPRNTGPAGNICVFLSRAHRSSRNGEATLKMLDLRIDSMHTAPLIEIEFLN
jgi:hypothetical protein